MGDKGNNVGETMKVKTIMAVVHKIHKAHKADVAITTTKKDNQVVDVRALHPWILMNNAKLPAEADKQVMEVILVVVSKIMTMKKKIIGKMNKALRVMMKTIIKKIIVEQGIVLASEALPPWIPMNNVK
jgi:hypothetical protein